MIDRASDFSSGFTYLQAIICSVWTQKLFVHNNYYCDPSTAGDTCYKKINFSIIDIYFAI